MKIKIGVSARHVHITKKHLELLFGNDFELEKGICLSQESDFASNSYVTISTKTNKIEKVRIVGPIRNYTQVEISKTDSYFLGLNPPIRNSGDLKDSENITIIGPKGSVEASESCIIAARHIHISPQDLNILGLKNNEEVRVKIGNEKKAIFQNVYVKAKEGYSLELHIDLDDANACLVKSGDYAEIKKIG